MQTLNYTSINIKYQKIRVEGFVKTLLLKKMLVEATEWVKILDRRVYTLAPCEKWLRALKDNAYKLDIVIIENSPIAIGDYSTWYDVISTTSYEVIPIYKFGSASFMSSKFTIIEGKLV